MVIDFEMAKQIASNCIQEMNVESEVPLSLVESSTIERDSGWVFFFHSVDEKGEIVPLAGNAPFIVSRKDGLIHFTGTAYDIEYYLDNFERTGDPYIADDYS